MAKQDKQQSNNDDRAKRTLYVTGFNSKCTTKKLLKELFTQGGPVADITMFDTHAYVRFQHPESVPYCLALFNEVELFGDKLRLNPRYKSENTFSYLRYLAQVRDKLRDEYLNKEPPNLPAKKYPESTKRQRSSSKGPDSSRNQKKRGKRLANKRKNSERKFEEKNDVKQQYQEKKQIKKNKSKRKTSQRNQPQKNKSIY